MTRKYPLLLLTTILLVTPNAWAQDVCNSLLSHGIYDHLVEIGAASSRASAVNDVCRAYYQEESDALAGKTGGSYGLISGEASFSSAQIKRLGSQMCSHNAADSASSDYTKVDQNLISTAAVNAWQECTRNTLLATQTDWQDTDQGTTGVAISFHLAGGGANNSVSRVTTTNIECTSTELNPIINAQTAQGVPLSTNAYSLDCKRTVANAPFQSGTRQVYAEAARVVIATSVGNITRDLPAMLPPPVPNPIPPGTIIAWYSTTQAPIPAGWKLCDGTGGTPDLRDRFIRGTGDYAKVGTPGGSNEISIPNIDLQAGQPDNSKGMRAEGGTGIVNHHSEHGNLENSFTQAVTVKTEGPPYTSMMYIMKQ
jgi:hypothetical protein